MTVAAPGPADGQRGADELAGPGPADRGGGLAEPAASETTADEADRPGDAPCLLRRVCPECGSVADFDPPTTCPQCGAALPGD